MSTPTKPNNSKDKNKADNTSVSSNSNSSGSTTPRATPRANHTSAMGASPSSSSNPAPRFSPSGFPRPMPPIDHSFNLLGWNAMPSAAESTVATSAAPVTLDSVFGRLKEEIGKLFDKEKVINAQENTISFRERTVRKDQKKVDDTAEKAREREHVANAKWNAAVNVEKDNKEEKERLEGIERQLTLREAKLQRREAESESREAIIRRFTGDALDVELTAVGRTGPTQQTQDLTSSENNLSNFQRSMQQHSSALFASAVDEPPRGRTLHSPHFRGQQPFSTTSSADDSTDLPFRSGQFSSLHPRRVSSANLSIATPTPLRVRRDSNMRRVAVFGNIPRDVYDSSGEEEVGESRAGKEQEDEIEASPAPAARPRERSVRRVSRSENLRG